MTVSKPTPSPAEVAWEILADSAPAPRSTCPHCSHVFEHGDHTFGPDGWCAVCWFVDGPTEAA